MSTSSMLAGLHNSRRVNHGSHSYHQHHRSDKRLRHHRCEKQASCGRGLRHQRPDDSLRNRNLAPGLTRHGRRTPEARFTKNSEQPDGHLLRSRFQLVIAGIGPADTANKTKSAGPRCTTTRSMTLKPDVAFCPPRLRSSDALLTHRLSL